MDEPVQKIRDEDLREAQGTPGLKRRVAFEEDGHWFGHAQAAPETMSGWHHHGDNVTVGYVISGHVTFEFGPGGRDRIEVGEGEYFRVPKHAVHREGNMSSQAAEVVVVRIGTEPVVVPAEGPDPR